MEHRTPLSFIDWLNSKVTGCGIFPTVLVTGHRDLSSLTRSNLDFTASSLILISTSRVVSPPLNIALAKNIGNALNCEE